MLDHTEVVPGIIALQLYDAAACLSIIDYVRESQSWSAAKVVGHETESGLHSVIKPDQRLASTFFPARESEVSLDFEARLNNWVKPLVNRIWTTNLSRHEGTQIVRYSRGNYYREHSDIIPGKEYRYFSVVCYLNDDYEGGQTRFSYLNYSISPQRGKAVIFPSTYIHRAEPVISGEKYVLISWLSGPPPIRWLGRRDARRQ